MPLPKKSIERTRRLRKNQTREEQGLWSLLRDRRFDGYKFRGQYAIGPFIADFCCVNKKLIIELDGGTHLQKLNGQQDRKRDSYLADLGYKVLRFWNSEVVQDRDKVLSEILYQLKAPSPRPSPSRERGSQ